MNIYKIITVSFVPLSLCALIGVSYKLFEQQRMMDALALHVSDATNINLGAVHEQQAPVEKIVSKSEIWRPIQDRVKDTVVQVFSQIAETDLLQPYKTPGQYSAYGSAFFINEEGDLITNAHVINQAKAVWIQIPSLGKRIIDVEVVGLSPDRDLALLRVTPESLAVIRKELGRVPYLELGDSDLLRRSDEVLALGYPLGQQSLKSTSGVISGREHQLIQMSAAINPGNSGGPLVNVHGEVVGVNAAGIVEAQNIGYIIPINDLKIVLPDLYKIKLLRKPFLGVFFNNANESLTEFLGNPQPGGCYVVEVVKDSPLYKAGVQRGDMIYQINGHRLDVYGEMSVPWSEDKISIIDYVARLSVGEDLNLAVYRNGARKSMNVKFSKTKRPAVRKIYPGYEDLDYEVIGGMVMVQLTLNHVHMLAKNVPGLAKYMEMKNQEKPAVIVTHIFPNSQLYRSRALPIGSTVLELNGIPVETIDDVRSALKRGSGNKFLTIRAADNVSRASDNIFVALPFEKVIEQEPALARDYRYALSDTVQELVRTAQAGKQAFGRVTA